MNIGITGLGRMGAGMARRWLRKGHRVVGHNRTASVAEDMTADGLEVAYSLEEVVSSTLR